MAGFLDDLYGDPTSMGWLGLVQGLGAASGASRLPVSMGQALGSAAGGLAQGGKEASAYQTQEAQRGLIGAETVGKNISSEQSLAIINMLRYSQGLAPLSLADYGGGSAAARVSPGAREKLTKALKLDSGDALPPASAEAGSGSPLVAAAMAPPSASAASAAPTSAVAAPPATDSGALASGPAVDGGAAILPTASLPAPAATGPVPTVPAQAGGGYMGMDRATAGTLALHKLLGMPMTPYQDAMIYANSLPPGAERDDAMRAAAKAGGMEVSIGGQRPGVAAKLWNPNTRSYDLVPGGDTPIMPESTVMRYDTKGNPVILRVPGGAEAISANTSAKARAEQAAILSREEAMADLNNQLLTGQRNPVFGPNRGVGGMGAGPGPAAAWVTAPPATATERFAPPGSTRVAAPAASMAPPAPEGGGGSAPPRAEHWDPVAAATANPGQPIETPRGSVLPPASEQSPPASSGSEFLKQRDERTGKLEGEWATADQANRMAEQRALAIADSMKQTVTGAWTTNKAAIAAKLEAVGLGSVGKFIMTHDDVAEVQKILKNNFGTAINTVKTISVRPTQMEVKLAQENFANPNLTPEANLQIMSEQIGALRWDRALALDWRDAKRLGWKDAGDFAQAWRAQQPNDLQSFVDRATTQIGPLKGMEGAPTAVPTTAAAPAMPAATLRWDPTANGGKGGLVSNKAQ